MAFKRRERERERERDRQTDRQTETGRPVERQRHRIEVEPNAQMINSYVREVSVNGDNELRLAVLVNDTGTCLKPRPLRVT